MSLQLLGLGGLLVVAALFVPANDYRDAQRTGMERAERRLATFHGLATAYTQRKTGEHGTAEAGAQSLFALFNSRTGQVGVADRVEKLRPQTGRAEQAPRAGQARAEGRKTERLEARLTGVYQDQGVSLLWELEQEPDVRIESLVLSRTAQGLLDMDLVLARSTEDAS